MRRRRSRKENRQGFLQNRDALMEALMIGMAKIKVWKLLGMDGNVQCNCVSLLWCTIHIHECVFLEPLIHT